MLLSASKKGVIFWKMISCVCFASINGLLKSISLPLGEIIFFQNAIGALFLWPWHGPLSRGVFLIPLFWMRGIISLVGVLLWTYAIKQLPLYQAVSVGILGPVVTMVGAHILFHETFTIWRLLAILFAVLGVIGIHYDKAFFNIQHLEVPLWAPVGATICFASVMLMNKRLLFQMSPMTSSFTALLCIALGVCVTISHWVIPSIMQIISLGVLGILTALAHLCLYKAIGSSDMLFLIPLGAVRLVMSALIGWWFFQESWTWRSALGTAFIIGALTLVTLYDSHLKKDAN